MVVRLTERERATILAALRRWLSYPAAREADSIATNRGQHKPLDDSEIQRLCKRIVETETKGDAASHRDSNNGARAQKNVKLRDDQINLRNLTEQQSVARPTRFATRKNRCFARASGSERRIRPIRG